MTETLEASTPRVGIEYDREMSLLPTHEGATPKDPVELARWLVKLHTEEPTDENGDDDGEDVDEEEDEHDESGHRRKKSTVEDDMEAIAAALELAKRVVDQLQLKMVLKAGQQMQEQEEQHSGARRDPQCTSGVGIPTPNARAIVSASCRHCRKVFTPFQRSRQCSSCAHTFCPKCSSKQIVLPSCFGFGNDVTRVCDFCVSWFQDALDRYFDALGIVSGKRTTAMRARSESNLSTRTRTPDKTRRQRIDNRQMRHSIATAEDPPSSKSVSSPSKPWFSGHLRAMHVSDRHMRRKSLGELDNPSPDTSAQPASLASPLAPPALHLSTTAFDQTSDTRVDSSNVHQHEDTFEPTLETHVKPLSGLTDLEPIVRDHGILSEQESDVITRKRAVSTSKRSKFCRSASFDLTNLHHPAPSTATTTSGALTLSSTLAPLSPSALSDDGASVRSGTSSMNERPSVSSKKCFDDSDIVDDHRSAQGGVEDPTTRAHDDAAVLRFAVYDVGAKEATSLKRSFALFGKKNIVLDRYTLELDCAQGIVRVKSVFMHRFWSFTCDAVQNITFSGSGSGVARVVVTKLGGHGTHVCEWQFGSDAERNEFRQAIETHKSTAALQLNNQSIRRPMQQDSSTDRPGQINNGSHDDIALVSGASRSSAAALMHEPPQPVEGTAQEEPAQPTLLLLRGEKTAVTVDVPATLLIGPVGDSIETSMVWGRLRGVFSVTNYRILFMPNEKGRVPYRSSTFGSVAYIPLFAIISAQVMYPGGRRQRSVRGYPSNGPPVLVVTCKDARIMRIEVEGPPSIADDRCQQLQALISRLADASQRYRVIEAENAPPLMSLDGPTRALGESANPDKSSASTLPSPIIVSTASAASPPQTPLTIDSTASPVLNWSIPVSTPPGPSPSSNVSTTLFRSDAFAFSYSMDPLPRELNGWYVYTDEREFKRQILNDPSAQPFLKFYQNGRGTMCSTYPAKLLVPSSLNSATLAKVAEFRAKNRLPVITYYHTRNRCVLVRSSQPLLGNLLSGSSSLSDQLLLGIYRRLPEIIKNQSHSAPSSRPIYIFDARKLKASTGNRLIGKGGVETAQDYPGAVVYHLNIANMYRMQSSFLALMKLVLPGGVDGEDKSWLSSLETTRWLQHVRIVLEGAVKIARVLELEGSSVVVHCSDGWDRTAQLTSLAQLMIDPFYRTIRGFAVLVEKDWCAFGHKFAERTGGDRARDPQRSKSSPVMFQFLDAVWQIQRQFPDAFEFNERFLLHLANSLTSGLYGTFLYDSRLQREANGVEHRTVSVWTPVLVNVTTYRNAQYAPIEKPIWPWTSTQMMHLWESYFFQWHPKYHDCRWISSLVHYGGKIEGERQQQQQQQPAASTNGGTVSGATPRSSSISQTAKLSIDSTSADESAIPPPPLSAPPATRDQSMNDPPLVRGSSGGSTSGNSIRGQRQQKKAPPMHKIFLFKS